MELSDLIEICRQWDRLGWAVQEQLDSVAGGQPVAEQNPSAMEMVADFLREVDRIVAWCDDGQLREQVTDLAETIRDGLAETRMTA